MSVFLKPPLDKPIPLGSIVKPWGKVAAVGWLNGERYYWLIAKNDIISMMPAEIVERADPGAGTKEKE